MQHDHCTYAIQSLKLDVGLSNVSTVKTDCKCPHEPTSCEWVGNGTHFACLQSRASAPQRVYTSFNGTKATRIESPRRSPTRNKT